MNIAEYQIQFGVYLQQWCARKRNQLKNLSFSHPLQILLTHGIDLISSEGKRVRPYIAYLSYSYHGGNNQNTIFQLGLVLELLHVFGLIHDDWMDSGKIRRGLPTSHILMAKVLAEHKRSGNLTHNADSQAILLGDLLFGWVYQELAKLPSNEAMNICFHRMVEEVILGQMIDIDSTSCETMTKDLLLQKMLLKTASYTFIYPLQLGALLAGNADLNELYYQLGTALGLAFQIQDDLLDILSDNNTKTAFSDIMNHQHSVCTQYILEQASESNRNLLLSLWGRPQLTAEEMNSLKDMFVQSGAVAFATKEMNRYFDQSRQYLQQWGDSKSAHELNGLITMIHNRLSS